jgi:Flp pilus assembly secretin CpaC
MPNTTADAPADAPANFIRHVAWSMGLLLALISGPVQAAEAINIPDTTVSLQAPTGFTPLTDAEIAAKFPRTNPPKYVVGNARRTTSIAYDLKPNPIKEAELEKGLGVFETMLARVIPGLVWKRKEIIEQAGQRWIYLEMTSTAIDTDIYNIMLITPFDGKMLVFNFNATKNDFATQEAALRASVASIR